MVKGFVFILVLMLALLGAKVLKNFNRDKPQLNAASFPDSGTSQRIKEMKEQQRQLQEDQKKQQQDRLDSYNQPY